MLVSAFAGIAPVRAAYQEAVARRSRFFSYGDAMYIIGQQPSLGAELAASDQETSSD
ncbi:MAG: S-adenosylmethionine:tRNA ribosyltransferase-isomerase, partial [Marinobacter sp.]|uniref:S-adenosylmethionine:tRNA ribosyltransferase-isomerase n=1 Tax=Marinobacter sp. TaxID=50741 RepID=UPI00299D5830